jgi:hypothetical protein
MGCGGSKPAGKEGVDDAALKPVGVSEPNTGQVDEAYTKKVHSAIRWVKPIEEVDALIVNSAQANCKDPGNGNHPIHIAAQNGHREYVILLKGKGADLNAQNKGGNTALHMSLQYGYWWTAKWLIDNGADVSTTNGEGNAASAGIEGSVSIDGHIPALSDAKDAKEIEEALDMLAADKEKGVEFDKAALVQAGMGSKKERREQRQV